MRAQDNPEAVAALIFPKVDVRESGHLSPLSAKLLLVELERRGFRLIKGDVIEILREQLRHEATERQRGIDAHSSCLPEWPKD